MMGQAGALHVDDGGTGAGLPVVFVPSLAGCAGQFAAQLAHLRRTRRALVAEPRGHGRSGFTPGAAISLAAYADDVERAVNGSGLDRFVLAGHSMGGAIACHVASRLPDRVAGLVLLDPASDGREVPADAAQAMLAALASPAYAETIEAYWLPMLGPSTPAVRAQVMADLRATPAEVVRRSLEALLSFDPVAALGG
ncbi:MAG: alpha/beta fold hydrolase [Myxococcales bacterium]